MSAASGEQSLQRMKKLKLVLLLTATYLAAEVVGAVVTGSLALLADAGHMLTDAGGLALAFFAVSFSRKPATPRRTYGFYRLEILASLANSVVLILLSIFVMYEAYRRFIEPPEVQSLPMIIVAAVGLVVNFAGLKILGEGHRHTHSKSTSQENDDHNHHDNMTKNERPKNLNIEGGTSGSPQ